MRAIALAAALLIGVAVSRPAQAADAKDLYARIDAAVRSLLGSAAAGDPEIIAPPRDIDPGIALLPPGAGRMRVIPPDARPRQQ